MLFRSRVNLVTPALFARFPDARAMAGAHQSELEKLIVSTGFFRQKSKSLIGMSTMLLKEHGGRVFELRVKGDSDGFVAVLREAGLECHATDEDVMRVFVPDGRGAGFLFQLASTHRVQVRHLRASVPTLDDVFADAVGEK